jgi:hypothetical protein
MNKGETPLEIAEHQVREGEKRLRRQTALLWALDRDTFPDEAAMTERLFLLFRDDLDISRAHLHQLQKEASA